MQEHIRRTLIDISNNFLELTNSIHDLEEASSCIIQIIENGGKIMFCGNGGSAADSQHLAAELVGRYRINRDPLSAVALTTDTSIITAIANDFSFDEIFSRQVKAIGHNNDLLYAVSTSGKSQNIINAIKMAKNMGIKVIGVTGRDSSQFEKLCDINIKAPADTPDRIQEMHIAIGQIICDIVERHFFKSLDNAKKI